VLSTYDQQLRVQPGPRAALAVVDPAPAIARRLTRTGTAIAISAMAVQTAAHLANALLLDGRYAALNATQDGNAFAWTSEVATFAGAFAAAVGAVCLRGRRGRLTVIALILAWLSLDDTVQVHEHLEHLTDGAAGPIGRMGPLVFLALYLPLLATALLLLWRAARAAPAPARQCMMAGLGLLAAAVGVRVMAGAGRLADVPLPDWAHALGTAAMQSAELGGWILVAAGLAAALCFELAATRWDALLTADGP
jgi:hypothetical protein